jgi:hypothetical protein
MSKAYKITVCSLPDYEQLVAEIYLGDEFVGLLSQEKGPEKTMIEINVTGAQRSSKWELALFEQALDEAKQRLSKLGWDSKVE